MNTICQLLLNKTGKFFSNEPYSNSNQLENGMDRYINYNNKNYLMSRNKFNPQMYNILKEKNHKTSLKHIKEDSNKSFNHVNSPQIDLKN